MARRLLLSLAAALGLPALAGAQTPELPGDARRGADLAARLCSGCHIVSPRQQGPATDAAPSFTDIAQRTDRNSQELIARLEPGHSNHPIMPEPPLDRQQIRDVVAYIRSLSVGATPGN